MNRRRGKRNALPPIRSELDIDSNLFSSELDVAGLSSESRQIIELMMSKMDAMTREIVGKVDEKNLKIEELEGKVTSLTREVS